MKLSIQARGWTDPASDEELDEHRRAEGDDAMAEEREERERERRERGW